MKVEVLPSAAEVARRAAVEFADSVARDPRLVVALPTGRTPIAMYEWLASERQAGRFDLGLATTFNLDEVLLPRSMPQTFYQFMTRHAWDALGVAPQRRRIPNGETEDPEAECLRYEAEIKAVGGLDLAILGIGADGHIAYNLPGQASPRTHVITLDPKTLATLGGAFVGPVRAITMGVETILGARRILLLATGPSKAEALRRMRDDPQGDTWPCTFFKEHTNLTVIADTTAASQL